MAPVIVTLVDNSEIVVYVDDIEFFLDEVERAKLDLVDSVEAIEDMDAIEAGPLSQPSGGKELVEVDILLVDGSSIQCSIPPEAKSELEASLLIKSCQDREVMQHLMAMAAVEKDLDARLLGTYAVINNIPTLSRRAKLHKQYIKRKTAYVVSMEALVDGAFRD